MKSSSILLCGCLLVSFGLCGCAATKKAPASRLRGEPAPVFRADQLLPEDVVSGANYRIAKRVPVEEYAYVFTIHSDYGDLEAHGRDVLDLRLSELHAIQQADKMVEGTQVVTGALDPVKDTGKGVALVVTEPIQTLERAPEGFSRMVSQYTDAADRRAGSLSRRQLAVELNCDPETSNRVLDKALDNAELRTLGGGVVTRAAMSFVPGLSVLPTTAQMKETIANNPPSVINKQIDKELAAAGVDKSLRTRFCKSPAFTTTQRLQVMEHFNALEHVEGRSALILVASLARNKFEALGVVREGKMLADIRMMRPVKSLEHYGLPLAVLADGTHIVICYYDYVYNTEEVVEAVTGFREEHAGVPTVFITAGRVSPAARQTFAAANVKAVENGPENWQPVP